MIDASGAGWLRIDINWDIIQCKGPRATSGRRFDRVVKDARARGLNVLGVFTYTPPWARPSPSDHYATPPKNTSDYASFVSRPLAALLGDGRTRLRDLERAEHQRRSSSPRPTR